MSVANNCVNFHTTLGSLNNFKQQCKKLLTRSLVFTSQPMSCSASSRTMHFNSSCTCSSISLCSDHRNSSSNDLYVACCISSCIRASSKELCVVHYNSWWPAQASSNNLFVTHYTSSLIWASSSYVYVMHCSSSHALCFSRDLCTSRTNCFSCATSNLEGGYVAFLIFPYVLGIELSP